MSPKHFKNYLLLALCSLLFCSPVFAAKKSAVITFDDTQVEMTADKKVSVSGKLKKGAKVTFNDQKVNLDPDSAGGFDQTIKLKKQRPKIKVVAKVKGKKSTLYLTVKNSNSTTPSSSIATSSQSASNTLQPTNGRFTATVAKYVDGDTTHFNVDGQRKKVRYLLIDTPELSGDQPFAAEARDRVQQILTSAGTIELEYDIGKRNDHYGRDLMYVWADGQLVQEILAREGLAMARYIEAPNTRYEPQVKAAELEAKNAGIGIWSIENYAHSGSFTEPQPVVEAAPEAAPAPQEAPPAEQQQTAATGGGYYIAPQSGTKYHSSPTCRGLRNANAVQEVGHDDLGGRDACKLCH